MNEGSSKSATVRERHDWPGIISLGPIRACNSNRLQTRKLGFVSLTLDDQLLVLRVLRLISDVVEIKETNSGCTFKSRG